MLASLLIVFREVIEAGLIIGIVLAASKGIAGRLRWVCLGIGGGLIGACVVAAFAGEIAAQFSGAGSELFNAAILTLAVAMLAWHNIWMSAHARELVGHARSISAAVASGHRTLSALATVVGIAVLREGSEVVLFLYGISGQAGSSPAALLAGGLLGVAAGAALSAVIYFGLLTIPVRKLFGATSAIITLLAAGMAAQAVLFVQQGGYGEVLTGTVWDTSAILPENSIVGRLLHTLIGYSDAPNGAQLVVYAGVITSIVTLMLWQKRASRQAQSLSREG